MWLGVTRQVCKYVIWGLSPPRKASELNIFLLVQQEDERGSSWVDEFQAEQHPPNAWADQFTGENGIAESWADDFASNSQQHTPAGPPGEQEYMMAADNPFLSVPGPPVSLGIGPLLEQL